MNTLPNIVLVHGAWADGSSWSAVIERLQRLAGFCGEWNFITRLNMEARPEYWLRSRSVSCARLNEPSGAQSPGPAPAHRHLGGGANAKPCTISWRFTSTDERSKLPDLYPIVKNNLD